MEDENPFQKAQTVDPEVRAYVYSLVNALGGSSADEDGRYVLGDDALACLRDLKRWLKLYDEKTNRLDVARCLAEAKLVNGDLLPILASWPENEPNDKLKSRVALSCLELLVPLTWPLENGGEMTVNHHRHTPYIQQAQVLYKAGILTHDTCSILRQVVRIGLPSIAMPRDDRTTRDEGIIKLMLYFLRNVTVIQQFPNLPSQGLDNEVSRSATIEAFRQQDVFALLLTICSNMGEDFNLQDVIVLEILFNMIKGVEAEKLWMTEDQRKGQDVSDLQDALTVEKGWERDYKKNKPTRHGRFGTMIWVKRDDEKMSTVSGQDNLKDGRNALFNMDKTKKWNKPQQRRKDIDHTINDFDRSTRLTPLAAELLRNFVEEFLDSGFNPLFTHLRRAIERESERIQDINYRQFFFTVSWFLQAERVRRVKQQKNAKIAKLATDFEVESYALVAAVLNQETFIALNRYMQTSYDNKEWQDLSASMRCFTQILLTVQEMAQSPLEEDQEIADNIQNRIFYEETTHDRIVAILKGYKDQGFGYLDACTELSHVFLRMLERYSKENVDLQIRSRKRARRKKRAQNKPEDARENGEQDDEHSENEDVADLVQISKERKFDFNRFAAKFTSQSSVNTFIAFTTFYRDLSIDQMKRAHRFFYRVAFKQELAVLLYRVDIVALFYKMIKGPEGLDTSHAMCKEWSELTKQVFKRMFKKLEQRPELVVEMLFSKINATLYYLEFGQEKQTLASTRVPVELEVKPVPGRDKKDMLGIVIAALQNDEKIHLVQWVRMTLEEAWDERRGWETEEEARKELNAAQAGEQSEAHTTTEQEAEKPSCVTVRPTDDEIRTAMFKNARLKLLMKLVGFEMLGDEDVIGATWIVPSALTAAELGATKKILEEFEFTPWKADHAEDTPESQIRRVKTLSSRDDDDDDVRRDAFIDDSEGEDEVPEEFMFPDNIRSKPKTTRNVIEELKEKRSKRKREAEPLDDEVLEARRKAKEEAALERRRKIKSDLYIRDSDDESDAEKDKEFFRREEEGRQRQEERIRDAMKVGAARAEMDENNTKRRKSSGAHAAPSNRKKGRAFNAASNDDDDDDELMLEADETVSSQSREPSGTEDEAEMSDTPLSSHISVEKSAPDRNRGLKELAQPRADVFAKAKGTEIGDGEDDDEEELPVSTARRRFRAGFIIDSDDDDDA